MQRGDFTVDLSALPPEARRAVCRQVLDQGKVQHDLGLLRQRRMKRLMDAVPMPQRGELRQNMIIDETQWVSFMQVYGQKCWSDPDFRKWLEKKDEHKDLFVKDTGTRIQSGYTGRGELCHA